MIIEIKILKNVSTSKPTMNKKNSMPRPSEIYPKNARLVQHEEKSINVINHINRLNKKNHMTV